MPHTTYPSVTLKPGREKSLLAHHPWIFSGAIATLPDFEDGTLLGVTSATGRHLGFGYFNKRSQIIGRMLTFDQTDPKVAMRLHIQQAIALRKSLYGTRTNALRLINAEGDFCPGLIVDMYDTVCVIQISTLGMERLKAWIVDLLKELLSPSWIVEVSTSPSRKQEGLSPIKQTLWGNECESIIVHEESLRFVVSPLKGQKTGFFADLREMRLLVAELSHGKRVLNCCSYTGAFSCHALAGGASFCASVDISKEACAQVTEHMKMNGFSADRHQEYVADVFDFLKDEKLDYDLVIIDPPAFAKQKSDIKKASKGYFEINRFAMAKMPKQSLLLTCSCSYHVNEELFRTILFKAANSAGREVRILQAHRLAFDHPLNIYHPEGSYLKSFLCYLS